MKNIVKNVVENRFLFLVFLLLLPQVSFSQIQKSSKGGLEEKVLGKLKSPLIDDLGSHTRTQAHSGINQKTTNVPLNSLKKTNAVTQYFWQQTNGPYGGGIASLAIDSYYNYLYAACNNAGVFLSGDNGTTWKLITDNSIIPSAQALAVNATYEIFLGTSDGIYQSINYGSTWNLISGALVLDVTSLAIDGNGYIFAGTYQDGIYRSTDNGTSWTQVNSIITGQVMSLTTTGTTVLAATWGNGMYRSTDYGSTWNPANTGITVSNIQSVAVAGGYVFAGTYLGGVFRSSDNGASWTSMNNGLTSLDIQALGIKSSGYIFAGSFDSGVFFSTDNGASWAQTNLSTASVRCFVVQNSGKVFTGTDFQGLFSTINDGSTWIQENQGLTVYVQALTVNTNGDVLAGTYNGGIYRSTDYGTQWTQVLREPGYVYSFVNGGGYTFAGTSLGVYRSGDNGMTWMPMNYGLNNTIALALAMNASGILLAGTKGGVYQSNNYGGNWQRTSAGLTDTLVRTLAVSNTTGYIFAGTYGGGGIFRSTDGGLTWTAKNSGIINYNDIRTLAVNSSGQIFAGTGGNGVFRSTDDGNTWVGIGSLTLTDTYINSIVINSNNHLFAGTPQSGVFKSTDNGNTWSDISRDLTSLFVIPLALNSNGFIFAGTGGGGVFKSTTASSATSTIYNASWTYEIDSDIDTYTSSRRLLVDADATDGSGHSVFLKLYQKLSSDASWTLYFTTPSYTITGASTSDTMGIVVGGTNGELLRNTYDFKVELFDASSSILQSITDPVYNSSLQGAFFETNAQDYTATSPVISSFTPSNGPVGTTVTIYGSNFGTTQGSSTVQFGGVTATPTFWGDAQIVVPVPSGVTGTVFIYITVNGNIATSGSQFTVPTTSPIINSFAPTNGPVGTTVTIAGSNFGTTQGSSTLQFGGVTATPTNWSDNQIIVSVPSGVTGTVYIYVTVNGITATSVLQFTLASITDSTPPNITSPTVVPSEVLVNPGSNPSSVSITASASDNESGVKSFTLEYMSEGDIQPTSVSFATPYESQHSIYIPSSAFIINGHARGVSYRLRAVNWVDLFSATPWQSLVVKNNFSITTPSGQFPAASNYPNSMVKAYRIFSVPYKLDNEGPANILSSLGPHMNNNISYYNWRFQHWNGSGTEDIEQFSGSVAISPGRGFFLIVRDPNRTMSIGMSRAMSAATLNATGIPLQNGWNIVGTPMNMNIPWSSLVITGNSTGRAYYDGNGPAGGWYTTGTMVDTLRPWSGLAIRMSGPGTVRFNILSPQVVSDSTGIIGTPVLAKQADLTADRANWIVPVSAYRSDIDMHCEGTGFGMAKEANEGYDRYDSYLPPIVGDKNVAVYFKNSEDAMMQDIRPLNENGTVWDMHVVTGDAGAKVKLQFGSTLNLPNPLFEAYLIDLDQKMAHNLKEIQSLDINSGTGIRNFRVVIGKKAYVAQNNVGIELAPTVMKLYANYPNPFNPETVIRYTIPNTSASYAVTLKIFNMLGQEIATLVNEQKQSGYYEVKWNALQQSSGVYFYQLSVADGVQSFQEIKKMVLMK